MLVDGTIITAENLFERSKENLFSEKEGELIYDISNKNVKIFSLNKETGNLEKKDISLAWKLDGGNLIKIKLRNGFSIQTTPEHKHLVLENLQIKERKARELKLGDRVICVRNLEIECNIKIKEEILKRLEKGNFYCKISTDLNKRITKKEKIIEIAKQIKSKIKPKSFYHGVWQNRYFLKDLLKIAEKDNIHLEDIYDAIQSIYYRAGKQKGKNAAPIQLPKNFEDFFYLAGLFIGDGHKNKFIVGKKELEKRVVEITKEIGIKVRYRQYKRTPELITNDTLKQVLHRLFDYPLENKSHKVKISDFVYKSPNSYVAKLLQGYFDTDGTVERSRRAVSITSVSNQMLEDLKLLLPRFGCIPIIQQGTLYLSGNSALNFLENIGFEVSYKAKNLQMLTQTVTGSLVSDVIPVEGRYPTTKIKNVEETMQRLKKQGIEIVQLKKFLTGDLAYIEITGIEMSYSPVVYDFTIPENHNFVAEGMIIHNTTFSDNLLAGAGMISEELAGKQLALDFHQDEQERGITIDAANVSMVHTSEGQDYLINLIDTPGHVDFGGDVTRAMRAVDGAIVLIDAVEGVMPQTETVLRQALRERVKPILFINKVDRLIKEVKLTPQAMQERFIKIIGDVNRLIESIAPEEFKEKWKVHVQEGSVCFGSAFHKWAVSFPYMQKAGMTFKDIIQAYEKDASKELAKKAPLHQIILTMAVKHFPNPMEAQHYRIEKIWHGEKESILGKSLTNCDATGPIAFIVTKIVIDKHAGEVAAGRLFSGTIHQGDIVYMNMAKREVRIQQVNVYRGAQRVPINEANSGNIIGLVGLRDTYVGETVSTAPMEPFEAIKHIFEPVVTKSIEARKPSDLPKLIEVLRQVGKEDPTIKIEINEQTGENLMSGMGELHLEVIENRIKTEKNVDVVTSEPIVVYRETIRRKSPEIGGKSPNKHNKVYFIVEPLEDNIYQTMKA
ncbi:elongation factor EF-2, partial [Candidatus Woesearchaeota archaeon]|nr:elongation factor EF-2 [Candidatus Woesearchaeota archaeon]